MTQPPPNPSTWLVNWIVARRLADWQLLAPHVERHDDAVRAYWRGPGESAGPPTLGAFLEQAGVLTREQRLEGERDAARAEQEFMTERSRYLAEEASLRAAMQKLPPPPSS